MTVEKGLDEKVADQIGTYVKLKGDRDLLEKLLKDEALTENKSAKEGLEDMGLLFTYLDIFGIMDQMSFDLSLARGLDYHTGIIYEAVTEQSAPPPRDPSNTKSDEPAVGVGSIAAGGRYDNLVGMFSGTNKKGEPNLKIPCVGVSIGVERVFSILMAKQKMKDIKSNATQVFIVQLGDAPNNALLEERMRIAKMLWDADISASFLYKNKPRSDKQWDLCSKEQIPYAVSIGKDELDKEEVKIKCLGEDGKSEVTVKRDEMVQYLKDKLATTSS